MGNSAQSDAGRGRAGETEGRRREHRAVADTGDRQLRSRGERVITSLPGQQGDAADMDCDRQLVEENGNWTVKPV